MHPYHHPLFINFIVYFNENQDYFECHEVLEEYWKSLPDGDKAHPITAYILLSTGLYHWRRGNAIGALRTIRKAQAKFPTFHAAYAEEIDLAALVLDVQQTLERLENELPFQSFSLRVHATKLQSLVETATDSMNLLPFGSDAIIHKHMLRDRSDILREREEKKKGRQD